MIAERYERLFAEMADRMAADNQCVGELFQLCSAVSDCETRELRAIGDRALDIIHSVAKVGLFNLLNMVIQRLADKERGSDNG